MVVQYHQLPGRIFATNGGKTWFDTNLRTFGLLPASKLTVSGVTIDFPDVVKDNAHFWAGRTIGGSPPQCVETFGTLITMVPQEWGPTAFDSTYTHNLPDILLGTVPAGTDFIDVQAVITRTLDPNWFWAPPYPGILGDTMLPIPPMGGNIQLEGGSCLLEECFPLSRGFNIILSGTSVILRRYQSVSKDTKLIGPLGDWNASNDPTASGYYTVGSTRGIPVFVIDWVSNRQHNTPFIYQRGQAHFNAEIADQTIYESTYAANFVITPGFFKADATVHAPAIPSAIRLGRFQNAASVSSMSTTMPFGTPDATRRILVAISTQTNGTAAGMAVSIGGVAATLLAHATTGGIMSDTSIWMASVPTGTSGTIGISAATTLFGLVMSAYALYNITAFHDAQGLGAPGSVTLTTLAGGCAFAAGGHVTQASGEELQLLSGIGHYGYEPVVNAAGISSITVHAEHGYQATTGANLALAMASGGGSTSMVAVSLG